MTAARCEGPEEPLMAQFDAHWLTGKCFALVLGLMIFAAFPQVVTGFHSFVFRDFGLFGYPLAHYYRESFWHGELPLWNPYNNFGIPFLAQWGTMVLYPPSLVYLLLPLPWSLGLFCLLHLWFGGIGMYWLGRRWTGHRLAAAIAGIAFSFNGFTVNCLMWPNYTASLAWMPWVVLLTWQSWRLGGVRLVSASFVGAMQMLSGTPEVILFTWLIVAGVWCCDHIKANTSIGRGLLRFGTVVALVAALSAAQLLPFFELLLQSDRDSNFASREWALPPHGWANFFVPLFRTFNTGCSVHFQQEQQLTSSYYFGVAVLFLAATAVAVVRDRRVWMLSAVTIVAFVLAMGEQGMIYGWLRKVIPASGFMRFPVKFLIIHAFAWPVLAAFGIAAMIRMERAGRWLASFGAIAVILIASIVLYARWVPWPDEQWPVTLRNGIGRIGFVLVIFGTLALALQKPAAQKIALALLLPLFWLDFLGHAPQQNPSVDPSTLTVNLPILQAMQPRPELGQSRALLSLHAGKTFHQPGSSNLALTYLVHRSGLFDNCNLIEGIPKADGFFALYLLRERDIHFRLFETDDRPRPQLARFLGISQISGHSNVLAWEPQTNFMPLVTAGQKPVFANRAATLAGMMATHFSPESVVFLPDLARPYFTSTNVGGARVLSSDVRRHRIAAEVVATNASTVVIAQALYPAWQAFVDGNRVKLWPANHAFQALNIGPGEHHIELIYRDNWFLCGLCISGFSLFGAGAVWLISVPARKRTGPASLQDTPAEAPSGMPGREVCG
jgi:hypothetical protein